MAVLPKISIITSCFNAADYVEQTIRSVVSQSYPDIEYIFLDAGSSDGTLAIANKYLGRGVSRVVCEPDDGQYFGIQKGFDMSTGEIMAWLNGDDIYLPWTLSVVGEIFATMPDIEWIIGTPGYLNERGQCTRVAGLSGTAYPKKYIENGWFRGAAAGYLQQESMFWRRRLWDKSGGLDTRLKLAADFDLWRRFSKFSELHSVNVPLAMFRQRPGVQRSSADRIAYESEVLRSCSNTLPVPFGFRMANMAGEVGRHLVRMVTWKKGSVITYSIKGRKWIRQESLRPLARTSLADVLLEYSIRRMDQMRARSLHQ